jgi:4-amino-4-deoxy-L-arabinose transferase-like glycosyltransferase
VSPPEPELSIEHEPAPARGLLAIAALGVALRLALAAPLGGRLEDPDNYIPLAHGLAEGYGLAWNGRPTAYRPPLYPLVLAPFAAALGTGPWLGWAIVALHAALGGATVLLTARAARRWGLAPGRVAVAALVVALDPVLAAQGRVVMTETLAALLLAAALAELGRPRRGTLRGGAALGLAALCRPSLLAAAALVAAAALIAPPGTWRQRLVRGVIIALTTLAMLAPWAIRNARVLGEPVWTTTHGGYTLALANNPIYYAEVLDGPPGAVWSGTNQARWFASIGPTVAGLSEPAADRRLRSGALAVIRERPRDFARAAAARLGRFWSVVPAGAVYPARVRIPVALWTTPLWAALAAGLAQRSLWRWPRIVAPAMLIALSIVHAAYWSDMRMRAPLVPAIALIASSASHMIVWRGRYAGPRGATPPSATQKKIEKPPNSAVQFLEKR